MPRPYPWYKALSLIPLLFLGGAAPKADNVNERRQAVTALTQKQDPAAGPALLAALKDKDAYVRILVLRGLAIIHYQPAGAPVAEFLETEKIPEVRQSAAQCLGALRVAESLPALEKALKDTSEAVRSAAANGLAGLRDPKGVPALAATAQDPSPAVRRSAAAALSLLGTPEALTALEPFTKDSDSVVQKIALAATHKKAK